MSDNASDKKRGAAAKLKMGRKAMEKGVGFDFSSRARVGHHRDKLNKC